jgi:hypothetical protein
MSTVRNVSWQSIIGFLTIRLEEKALSEQALRVGILWLKLHSEVQSCLRVTVLQDCALATRAQFTDQLEVSAHQPLREAFYSNASSSCLLLGLN